MEPAVTIQPPLAARELPPLSTPVLLDETGSAWIPHAWRAGCFTYTPICEGIGAAWTPVPEIGKVLLAFAGGNPFAPTDEAIAIVLSRDGLRELIADLRSIDRQWEARD